MELKIVSGRSGSGKTICLRVLEDMGYYCVDNLPLALIPQLIEVSKSRSEIAIGIDARNMLDESTDPLSWLSFLQEKKNISVQIIYLDAQDEILVQRFNDTRRKHPLTHSNISLMDAIIQEKRTLHPLAERAHIRLDTSHWTPSELKQALHHTLKKSHVPMTLYLESFGFKYGAPYDADFIFDVRCLPNPYWHKHLSKQTGLDQEVQDFLDAHVDCQNMFEHLHNFLSQWIPAFVSHQRHYLHISVGCTGGQHRSVYLVEKLAQRLRVDYPELHVQHRELS